MNGGAGGRKQQVRNRHLEQYALPETRHASAVRYPSKDGGCAPPIDYTSTTCVCVVCTAAFDVGKESETTESQLVGLRFGCQVQNFTACVWETQTTAIDQATWHGRCFSGKAPALTCLAACLCSSYGIVGMRTLPTQKTTESRSERTGFLP